MKNLFRFTRALFVFIFPRSWGPFTETYEKTKFDHAFSVSWSQGAEDLALLSQLPQVGFYIDIGAHHPNRFSVTRHLYQNGWHGINVDANSQLVGAFNLARPRDTNLCYAVGNEKNYEITIFEEPAISTINKEWERKFLDENQKISRKEFVKGITLSELFKNYTNSKHVNLLSIDIEGADYDALQSLGLEFLEKVDYPDWILLETNPPIDVALGTSSVHYCVERGYIPWLVLPMATLLKYPNKLN